MTDSGGLSSTLILLLHSSCCGWRGAPSWRLFLSESYYPGQHVHNTSECELFLACSATARSSLNLLRLLRDTSRYHVIFPSIGAALQARAAAERRLRIMASEKRSISSMCGLNCSNTRSTPAASNSASLFATCSGVPTRPERKPRLETE
jgi:hypothetical protein